jgi:hypothetical protein
MAGRWLLIEGFGGDGHDEPTVIGVGSTPKHMVAMSTILGRGRYLDDLRAVVARVLRTGEPVRTTSQDGRRQVVADPLIAFSGDTHGVYAWMGAPDETPPPRDPAGAWYFNLSTNKIGGSDDLLDLYGVAPELRRTERVMAEAFTRLVTNADEAAGLAVIVRAEPGVEHQATWTVRRDDGQLRAANFACRSVRTQGEDGDAEVVLRGITHDIGEAEKTPSAPVPMVLAERVLAAERAPGTHRAIVNLRTLALLRWVDEPMPGVAWENDAPHGPAIHPDDLPIARQMSDELGAQARTSDKLRVRAVTGDWLEVQVEANLLLLDQHTTAALVTIWAI